MQGKPKMHMPESVGAGYFPSTEVLLWKRLILEALEIQLYSSTLNNDIGLQLNSAQLGN